MTANKWTEDEIEILKMYYPNKDIALEEIHNKYIKNHTIKNIVGKANSIGLLRKEKPKEWTDEETKLLIENYDNFSIDTLIEKLFPDRKKNQIIKKAKELNLVKKNKIRNGELFWTDDRIALLYNEYPYVNTEDFYNKYFKDYISMSGLYMKVNRLGIKKDKEFASGWTDDQDNYLKKNYEDLNISVEEISYNLGKSVKSVQNRAVEVFDLHRREDLFSEKERELIKELYPDNRTSDFIYMFPNRTVDQLDRYARRMGVKKTKDYIRYVTLDGTRNSLEISKPQKIINDILDEMNINYIPEYDCKYYLIDHYLVDSNLMIEVQGDFWHCSPLLSKKSNTSGIQNNKLKDKRKHTYIKNEYGIEILYLWETDINEDINKCKELIKLYIENNGVLENYHSFNYDFVDGRLELIEEKYAVGY